MKKSIFSIMFVMLFTAIAPEAKSEVLASNTSNSLIHILLGKNSNESRASKRLKKRKLKKLVRKSGRIYRDVKTDKKSKKKSRKVQRNLRRIINVF